MWEQLLRWPVLVFISIALSVDFALYLVLRAMVFVYELLCSQFALRRTRQSLFRRLQMARTYSEWRRMAEECDAADERTVEWKREPTCPHYNSALIINLTKQLWEAKAEDNHKRLADLLESAVLRSDVGGIDNALLYSQTFYKSKYALEDFLDTVEDCMKTVLESPTLSAEDKRTLGETAERSFGRTALCLSGGAALGFYHLGVLKVLVEEDLLPTVISGTSAGAVLAAWLCTRTREQLKKALNDPVHLADLFTFTTDSWPQRLWRLLKQGHLLDVEESMQRGKRVVGGGVTFYDAWRITGRVLNITVNSATPHGPPRILNYQTAPNVLIYSAILASASVPGLLPAMQLRSRTATGHSALTSPSDLLSSRVSLDNPDFVIFDELGSHWRDGSISIDIPSDLLRPMFNVHYTIASQVNPGVVYFFYHARGAVGEPHGHRRGRGWRGGFFLSLCETFLKLDMKRYLELLAGMDLLPKFLRLDWSLLALQRRDGTVTILPRPPTLAKLLLQLLAVPTPASIELCVRVGELATWPAVHMISNRMRVERLIALLANYGSKSV